MPPRLPVLPTEHGPFSPSPSFLGMPRVLPASDGPAYDAHGPCRSFRGATECGIEWDEWVLARALISPASHVLELGARYGTSSCVIAKAQGNSGRLVSVEPDGSAQFYLRYNRLRNRCNFAIVNGTVGMRTPMRVLPLYYATHTRRANLSRGDAAVPNLSISAVEALLGWRIDTLFVDCEGCIERKHFQRSNPVTSWSIACAVY